MDSVLGHLHALLAFGQGDCYSTLAASISSGQISSTDVAQAVCTYMSIAANQTAMISINGRQFTNSPSLVIKQHSLPIHELFTLHDSNKMTYGNLWLTWYNLCIACDPSKAGQFDQQIKHIAGLLQRGGGGDLAVTESQGMGSVDIRGLMDIAPQMLQLIGRVIPSLQTIDGSMALSRFEETLTALLAQAQVANAKHGTALIMQGLRVLCNKDTKDTSMHS